MQVSTLSGFGGPDVLVIADKPRPAPAAGEVLIRVAAAGVNRADILQREGHYPPPAGAPDWLGLEVSGTVAEVGAGVTRWSPGDRVCALVPGGGYAEYVAVAQGAVLPVPDGLSMIQAAGLVEAACTVWSNLQAADARAGQTILIHGGSGGVGSVAIQIATAMGMTVITTARGGERTARCRELGADVAVDYAREDFVAAARELGGADVILDVVGAAYLERNLAALAADGTLVVIGLQKGTTASLNLGTLLTKRARLIGTTLRSRPPDQRDAIVAAVERDVWPWVPDRVAPVIHATYPLEQAADAHRALESGEVFGSLVLTVDHRG